MISKIFFNIYSQDSDCASTLPSELLPGRIRIWTICRGATTVDSKLVAQGMKLSQEKCDQVNAIERDKALVWVECNVYVPMTEPQREGIASFCPYNIGPGKCFSLTFYRKLNAGDRKGACDEIRRWVFDGGRDCRQTKGQASGCFGQVE